MIAYLKGKIRFKSNLLKKDNYLVVDVGGVGYKVFALDKIINNYNIDDEIELHIFTQVAETVLDLYGFAAQEEMQLFELLIDISGIGPRSAMDIMRKAKLEDIKQGAQTGNYEVLAKLSGLGPKTAQKVVVGLKDKFGGWQAEEAGPWRDDFGEALEALVGLGYSSFKAREALSRCTSDDTSSKIREALKILSQK